MARVGDQGQRVHRLPPHRVPRALPDVQQGFHLHASQRAGHPVRRGVQPAVPRDPGTEGEEGCPRGGADDEHHRVPRGLPAPPAPPLG